MNETFEIDRMRKDYAFDSSIIAFAFADLKDNINYINKSFLEMWGFGKENEVLGKPFVKLWKDEKKTSNILKRLHHDEDWRDELVAIKKDGSTFNVQLSANPVKDKTGKIIGTMASFIDITERKRLEQKKEELLEEKETMLKEIYHRIKNNFSFITSLLDLQSRRIKDQQVREQFRSAKDRIRSMAMVHEKLYKSESLSEINFNNYINDLVGALLRSHHTDVFKVSLKLEIENVYIGIDKAIPCGLIISELFINSLKYAFPPGRKKTKGQKDEIIIKFYQEEKKTIVLKVSDNGVGLPEGLDFFETESLGLLLVRLLAKQIYGTIELEQNIGTGITIKFKA